MLIGIFSAGVFGWLGAILGILGIIFGAIARKNALERSGLATAGLVLSIIGLILGLILYIACAGCLSMLMS